MKILYIAPDDPREIGSGGLQRTHFLWQALKRIGEVYTVVLKTENASVICDDKERIVSTDVFPSGFKARLQSLLYTHWFKPSMWWWHYSFNDKNPWKGVEFDVVVGRYLYSVVLSRAWRIAPCFVDIDDLPTEAFETIYCRHYYRWWRPIARAAVNAWQRKFLSKCKGAWLANPKHVEDIHRILPCRQLLNMAMRPAPSYTREGRQRKQIMTVGMMDYEPNYSGVYWFLENVWPKVHAALPDLGYVICGRRMRQNDVDNWRKVPGVAVMGAVEDIDAVYEESLATVAPILSGSGTCIKVIESALHGRVTFATNFAARGLSCEEKERLGILSLDADAILQELAHFHYERQQVIQSNAEKYNSFDNFVSNLVSLIGDTLKS